MFLPPDVDTNKCIKLCLLHDIAESIVGDLTPADNVPKAEKNRREALTIAYIKDLLSSVNGGKEGLMICDHWLEFEKGETRESQYANDIDKLEMLIQVVDYETQARGQIDLSDFMYVITKLRMPETKEWAESLLNERREFWADRKETGVGETLNQTTKEQQDQYYG